MDSRKAYRATVRLGRETDTYDRTGTTIAERDTTHVQRTDVERELREFEGEIDQAPPAYSAIKREGVPLYKLARAGEKPRLEARRVHVYYVNLISFDPPLLTIELECGKGTYVRSLAHDLGERLGVGGSLEALVRTRVGPFLLKDAVDLEALRSEFEAGAWAERLLPVDSVLLEMPAAILCEASSQRVRHGLAAELIELFPPASPIARAYTCSGDFLAVLRREAPGRWRPSKVFDPA